MGSVRHLLTKTAPTVERTMYRDISLLVCALQGPQFDPGGEGMGPLTDICNTVGGGWGVGREWGHLQIYVTL